MEKADVQISPLKGGNVLPKTAHYILQESGGSNLPK
jgi:hypothetical protein